MRRRLLLLLLAAVALVVLSMPLWLDPATRGPRLDVTAPEGLAGFGALLRHWGASVETLEVEISFEAAGFDAASEVDRDGEPVAETPSERSAAAWSEALEGLDADAAVVLAFPATSGVSDRLAALRSELRGGRTVMALYSGLPLAFEEGAFLESLGVGLRDLEARSRLAPWSWWRDRRQGYAHRLDLPVGGQPSVEGGVSEAWSDPIRALVDPAAECDRIAEFVGPRSKDLRPEGRALSVARCRVGEGELLLAPTSLLTNARLGATGNLQVASALAEALGPRIRFLEGGRSVRVAALDERAGGARRTLNLVAVQLVLLYLVALLALARGFGPRWPPLNQPADAQRRFLLSVGALHRRLGHFGAAARTLQTRWLEYDPLAGRRGEEPVDADAPLSEDQLLDWAVRHSRSDSTAATRAR